MTSHPRHKRKEIFSRGHVAKNLVSIRDQGEEKMIVIHQLLRRFQLSTSRLVQPQDLPGLALPHQRAELVGGDVLKEIKAEPIMCTKCVEAPLRDNNFQSTLILGQIRSLSDEKECTENSQQTDFAASRGNWRYWKVQRREILLRGLNGSNFCLETESNRLQDQFWR